MNAGVHPASRRRLLLIGPLPVEGEPIGGTQVSFAELLGRFRDSRRFDVEVLDTSRPCEGRARPVRAWLNMRSLASVLLGIRRRGRACDAILFCASRGAMSSAGPLVWLSARLVGRPLAVRLFGGSLDLGRTGAPSWRRWLLERTVLRAPLLVLQTRALTRRFESCPGVRWLPTTRDLPPLPARERRICRRFLFLSQVRAEKGLFEALAASDRLPPDCSLSVYGPMLGGVDRSVFRRHPRAEYHGAVAPAVVPEILACHDAFVYPSWHAGEGLPGALIEALQAGLPVIATRFLSIPELIEDGRCGLLVEPRSDSDLAAAMSRLAGDPELYARLARGARRRGDGFRSARWQDLLETWLLEASSPPDAARGDEREQEGPRPRCTSSS